MARTILPSAFLLFLAQPTVAKQILPWFGGSAAVWATCLVFFARADAAYDAVAFAPAPDQEPVTWTGEVTRAGRDRSDRPSRRRR